MLGFLDFRVLLDLNFWYTRGPLSWVWFYCFCAFSVLNVEFCSLDRFFSFAIFLQCALFVVLSCHSAGTVGQFAFVDCRFRVVVCYIMAVWHMGKELGTCYWEVLNNHFNLVVQEHTYHVDRRLMVDLTV